MEEQPTASKERPKSSWPRYDAADLGFPNYWYPVFESRKLKKRPEAIQVCGEKIVLIRQPDGVHALHNRCPHRGIPLSAGKRVFSGTISCRYHGWTYDTKTGELVAALTDGPDSAICGRPNVRVKSYPCEERGGLIWVYIGDEPHPPIEEDVPEELVEPDAVVEPMVELRRGDWRYAMENAVDEAHARFLHRNSPFYGFTRFPAYQLDVRMEPTEDGKWLRRLSTPVFGPAEYPGLGKWGGMSLWRYRGRSPAKGKGSGVVIMGAARLPAIFYVGHEDWADYQMFVPVDREHHLNLQVSVRRTKGLGSLLWRLRYWTYIRFVHHIVLNRWEDGFIVERMDCPPERLFRPDSAIIGWRRWCDQQARRSAAEATKPAGEKRTRREFMLAVK